MTDEIISWIALPLKKTIINVNKKLNLVWTTQAKNFNFQNCLKKNLKILLGWN